MTYYLCRSQIVQLYIQERELHDFIVSVMTVMCFNTLPEVFKGYLNGVFKAFSMQSKAMVINLSGCWIIQSLLVWFFAFEMEMGIKGIFIAKILMETYLMTISFTVLSLQDWH